MKKSLAVCACVILFSFVLIPRTIVYSQKRGNARQLYADDRIIVKLKAEAEPALDADALAEEIVRAPGVRAEALTSRTHGGIKLIHLNNSVSVEEGVRRAKEDPRVEYAEPDYFVYAMDTIPNDPRFFQLWGLYSTGCTFCGDQQTSSIVATQAWDITQGSEGSDAVVAAVLDTGLEVQHEDLAANVWVNPSPGILPGFVDDANGWNFVVDTNKVFTDPVEDEHGTHVAGSLGAVGNNNTGVTGVAWHAKLMSLKFLHNTAQGTTGSTADAVRGINYAIDMRSHGVNVRVINASWGGPRDSQALRDAISAANDAGILFVCAAGNSGANLDDVPDFPSVTTGSPDAFPGAYGRALPNVISVAAVDQDGGLAAFSDFGHGSVSLAAPGVFIWSTWPTSLGGYNRLSGTSMSSPYVSGIAVLLWSHEPSLTPAQVKQRIIDSSDPLPSLVSKTVRSGRADAYAALRNTFAPAQKPLVLGVQFPNKRTVTIDGFGFIDSSAVVEVDGTPLPTDGSYDSSFALANGTLTRLTLELGKKPLKRAFPGGVQVNVDVFNPTTGERSPLFSTARY